MIAALRDVTHRADFVGPLVEPPPLALMDQRKHTKDGLV